jgi:uncharacterized protein
VAVNQILEDLLEPLPEGEVEQVLIGRHWTAVVVQVEGQRRCGLASTLAQADHEHGRPDVPQAGELHKLPARELAALARSDRPLLAGVGLAAANALLEPQPEAWLDLSADELIARHGAGKRVAVIGHFPFLPALGERVGRLWVLEMRPQPGDLPADAAPEILPQAEVVAITGTAMINHTLQGLLSLCAPGARVILLGPSAPLSLRMFGHGLDAICGSVVTRIEPVLAVVGQGGNFRQVHRAGVRRVTMVRPGE